MGNLKQLGTAYPMYSSDYNDYVTPLCNTQFAYGGGNGGGALLPAYLEFLSSYAGVNTANPPSSSIIYCPGNRGRQSELLTGPTAQRGMYYQGIIGSWPANNIWIKSSYLPKAPKGGAGLLADIVCRVGTNSSFYIYNNHGNNGGSDGGNVMFYDGHVEWKPITEWNLKFTNEGQYYLNDHATMRSTTWGYGSPNAALWDYPASWN